MMSVIVTLVRLLHCIELDIGFFVANDLIRRCFGVRSHDSHNNRFFSLCIELQLMCVWSSHAVVTNVGFVPAGTNTCPFPMRALCVELCFHVNKD
jgi:hypothetical protein